VAFKDLKEMRACYSGLRELIIQNSGGWEDAETRARIEALCQGGMEALDDAECRERLRAVLVQAADLFSTDGHNKWARKTMSGADYLRLQILISLEALNTRLFFIDTLRGRKELEAGSTHP
jgi:hypothetical protein